MSLTAGVLTATATGPVFPPAPQAATPTPTPVNTTVGGYSVVVLGLVALGAHINRGVLRILKAVELLRS